MPPLIIPCDTRGPVDLKGTVLKQAQFGEGKRMKILLLIGVGTVFWNKTIWCGFHPTLTVVGRCNAG